MRLALLLLCGVVGVVPIALAEENLAPKTEGKIFAPLGSSKVALIKSKDNHGTPFYVGQVTNQNYFVHGKQLLAVKSLGTFQYAAVDSWPSGINVDVYSIQQAAKAKTSGLPFDPSLPVTISSKPTLSIDGDSVKLLLGNTWKYVSHLPDIEINPEHAATLAKSYHWVCCTAEGAEHYYNLATGQQIASHSWDDENIQKNNVIPLIHYGEWLLISYALDTPKPTDKALTLHLSSITQKQKDERTITVPLPKTFGELCVPKPDPTFGTQPNHCYLDVALDEIIVKKEIEEVVPEYNLSPIRINLLSHAASSEEKKYPLTSLIPDSAGRIVKLSLLSDSEKTSNIHPVSTISH